MIIIKRVPMPHPPSTLLHQYRNGNTTVSVFEDGTKTRSWDSLAVPTPEYPESIDLKITDCCDAGCPWCHESSTIRGKHANLFTRIINSVLGLPAGTEIAIGGGNPLSHPHLEDVLYRFKSRGLVSNITVNGRHINRESIALLSKYQADQLIHGIGISYYRDAQTIFDEQGINDWYTNRKQNTYQLVAGSALKNIVYHLILGVDSASTLEEIENEDLPDPKVLLLGYKWNTGRGSLYPTTSKGQRSSTIEWTIREWSEELLRRGKNNWRQTKPDWQTDNWTAHRSASLSFDNLAIDQLNMKEIVGEKVWGTNFMGREGEFSMYVDAVAGQFAVSSTSPRHDIGAGVMTIKEMFQVVRQEAGFNVQ